MQSTKNPERTRLLLLEAGFHEIHREGFRGASLDAILRQTGVTKGALYHHFPNKTEFGYAIVDELVARWIEARWAAPLLEVEDPLQGLIETVRRNYEELDDELIRRGCPLNNLAQEMSSLDEGFRVRISRIVDRWTAILADALRRAQEKGSAASDFDPEETAQFLVVSLEGIAGAAKIAGSKESATPAMRALMRYLQSLKTPQQTGARS